MFRKKTVLVKIYIPERQITTLQHVNPSNSNLRPRNVGTEGKYGK